MSAHAVLVEREPDQSTTTQVGLRRILAGDRARLLAWRNDPAVAAFMYCDDRITPKAHRLWFDQARADPSRRFWIIEADGLPMGLASLTDIDLRHRRCSWAYYLAAPEARGRGIGSAVEFLVIEYVFSVLALDKLWCEVLASNESVWRLHERHGFQREAVFRQHILKAGLRQDVFGMGLTIQDWTAHRQPLAARLKDKNIQLVVATD